MTENEIENEMEDGMETTLALGCIVICVCLL